jgi:rhodanese-related sulfurtransferase
MSTIQTITTDQLRQRLGQEGDLQFWNVLTDEYFKGESIPGSRRVPVDTVEQEVSQIAAPKDAEIVVYCAGPSCPASSQAAQKLTDLGYINVKAYEGGIEDWKKAGLKIDAQASAAQK